MTAKKELICWQVRLWNVHFEIAQSRKYPKISWVAVPNKHDGKGFRRIARNENNIAIFCAWNLIVQVASKMPLRGVLADEDGPLTFEDLADVTSYPAGLFATAIPILASPEIRWLEDRKDPDANLGEVAQPARRNEGFTRAQSFDLAVADLVKQLRPLKGKQDAFSRCLGAAWDKYKDLGRDKRGLAVPQAALEIVNVKPAARESQA